MAPLVCTDDEVLVDRVITEKKMVGERLPSYGRDLVPYFVPGTSTLDEKSVNTNTDIDAHRRAGGGVLAIPPPGVVSDKRQKKVSRKKVSKSPPKQAVSHQQAQLRSAASAEKVSPAPRASDMLGTASRMAMAEPWAGPAYVNSPPPSSLPVPGFLRAQQGETSSFPTSCGQPFPASPLRMGKLFPDVAVQDQYPDRAAVEFSLKRILQVA